MKANTSRRGQSLLAVNSTCITKKNLDVLNTYYNEYTMPFYNDETIKLDNKFQTHEYESLIRSFKPYINPKKTKNKAIVTINKIAVMSLTSLEKSMNIANENHSLVAYIKMLEEKQQPAINADINTAINVSISFAIEYLLYIQKYGPPVDGIFNPILLAEFL